MNSSGLPSTAQQAALAGIRAVAFDLDGTLYLGERPLPGAQELVALLRRLGKKIVFVTNNSSADRQQYLRRLRAMGIHSEGAELITSNDVAIARLKELALTAPYLVATASVIAEYQAAGFDVTAAEPDCVVLTFDTSLSYTKIERASRHIRANLPYFATHPDLLCPTEDGPIPDCGTFIALLEAATGASPIVLGKPEEPMARTIAARCQEAPEDIAMIGDRLYTDVKMANRAGFTSILTLSGETARADLSGSEHRPAVVVDSLRELLPMFETAGKPLSG